jgi:hypothetical protein
VKARSVSSNERELSNHSKGLEEFEDLDDVEKKRPFDEHYLNILTNEVLRHTEGKKFNDKRKNPLVMMWMSSKAEMSQREVVRRRVEEDLRKGIGGVRWREIYVKNFKIVY